MTAERFDLVKQLTTFGPKSNNSIFTEFREKQIPKSLVDIKLMAKFVTFLQSQVIFKAKISCYASLRNLVRTYYML